MAGIAQARERMRMVVGLESRRGSASGCCGLVLFFPWGKNKREGEKSLERAC